MIVERGKSQPICESHVAKKGSYRTTRHIQSTTLITFFHHITRHLWQPPGNEISPMQEAVKFVHLHFKFVHSGTKPWHRANIGSTETDTLIPG